MNVRVLLGVLVALTGALVLTALVVGLPRPAKATGPDAARLPDLRLATHEGDVVGRDELAGHAVVVAPLDAQCEDLCPSMAAVMRLALDRLSSADRPDVRLLGLSVDPAGDTPSAVAAFERAHRLTGELAYLVGPQDALRRAWRALGITPSASSGVDELHSAAVRVYDRHGRAVATLLPGIDLDPPALASAIRSALR